MASHAARPSPWWARDVHADRRPFLLARNRITAALRGFFAERDFVEVETAALQASPGNEAHLHAFATEAVGPDGSRRPLYLQEGMPCMRSTHTGVPIAIELPHRLTLHIVETDPVVKGQTASSSYKPAKLSNGARTMVPPHITAGTRVVIQTEDGSYVERAKD